MTKVSSSCSCAHTVSNMQQARRIIWLFYAFQITVTMMLWLPMFYAYQQ